MRVSRRCSHQRHSLCSPFNSTKCKNKYSKHFHQIYMGNSHAPEPNMPARSLRRIHSTHRESISDLKQQLPSPQSAHCTHPGETGCRHTKCQRRVCVNREFVEFGMRRADGTASSSGSSSRLTTTCPTD